MLFSRVTLIVALFFLAPSSFAVETLPPIVKQARLLGRVLSIRNGARVLPSGLGIRNVLQSEILGRIIPIASLAVEAGSTPRTELYLRGIRVWSGDLHPENGQLVFEGGVAPMQIAIPALSYPIGPVLLQLRSGVEFGGTLRAFVTPNATLNPMNSGLSVGAKGDLAASAFLEGAGNAVLVRGGLNGRVILVEGTIGAQADLSPTGGSPQLEYLGQGTLMKGGVDGFLDTRLPFRSWKRIFSKSFLRLPGTCFAFGGESCLAP